MSDSPSGSYYPQTHQLPSLSGYPAHQRASSSAAVDPRAGAVGQAQGQGYSGEVKGEFGSGSPAGNGKRRMSSVGEDEEGSEEDGEGEGDTPGGGGTPGGTGGKKPRKRNRQALSCTECKRRKIKCDRKTPCEACCRRGEEKSCHWEAAQVTHQPQPFALATEHDLLKARVAHLESLILASGGYVPKPPPTAATHRAPAPGSAPRARAVLQSALAAAAAAVDELPDRLDPDSDTEDAALVLEELALGRPLPRAVAGRPKARGSISTLPQTPSTSTPGGFGGSSLSDHANSPANASTSRAMSSLLTGPLEPRRKVQLEGIWKTLPTTRKVVMDYLVLKYHSRAAWAWHLLHKPTFDAEYEAFHQLIAQARLDEVDPTFLAVLNMVFCLAVNALDEAVDSPLVSITAAQLESWPVEFFQAAQSCLECADWTGKPRIRTLQAIALFAPYLLFAGSSVHSERFQTYLGAAIRMAQQLGLHQLGHDPTVMPAFEDPALPPGVNSLRRQIPIRLLHALLSVDFMILRYQSFQGLEDLDCALPGNFNDSDLTADAITQPRSLDEATDSYPEIVRFKIACAQRKWKELKVGKDGEFDYEAILDLDKVYQEILASTPANLKQDYAPPLGEDLPSLWRRCMLSQTIHNRLLRLHRPFLARGWREPKFAYSTRAALDAARLCLVAQQSLTLAPLLKGGFQTLHVQGAIVVLFNALWTEDALWREVDPVPLERHEDYGLIREAFPFLERCLSHKFEPVRKVAGQALQTVGLLLDAIEKRKQGGGGEVETFGRLLKRIGGIVVASSGGLPGTPASVGSLQPPSSARATPFNPTVLSHSADSAALASGPGGSTAGPASLAPVVNNWFAGQAVGLFGNEAGAGAFEGGAVGGGGAGTASAFGGFDLQSLAGPEYADPSFDWGGWGGMDQFGGLSNA